MSDPEIRIDETYATIQVENNEVELTVEGDHITIEDARSGPQGATGPTGPAGSDTTYVHTQTTPAAIWTIQHDLDKFPAVDVVDSASNVVIGEIHYDNENRVTITFVAAFSGKAFLN